MKFKSLILSAAIVSVASVALAATGNFCYERSGETGEMHCTPSPGYTSPQPSGYYTLCNWTDANLTVSAVFANGCGYSPAMNPTLLTPGLGGSGPNFCTNAWLADVGLNRPVVFGWCTWGTPFFYCSGNQTISGCQ